VTASDVVSDPIGQLNLILWATRPLPEGHAIRPVLRDAGYELRYLGPALPLTPALRERLIDSGLPFRERPRPDVLLRRSEADEYLLVECKRTMFGPCSSSASQTRGLLLQTPDQLRAVLYLSPDAPANAHLAYVTRHYESPNPAEGIASIADQLGGAGFEVIPAGIICLEARDDGIYMRTGYFPGVLPAPLLEATGHEVLLSRSDEGGSPLPLLLIPWEPSLDRDSPLAAFGKWVLYQRLLTHVVIAVGHATPGHPVDVFYDAMLSDATFTYYERWRALNREIATYLRGVCGDLITGALREVEGVEIEAITGDAPGRRLTMASAEARGLAVDALTAQSRKSPPDIEGEQLSLFDLER
jgi:hypothetical protein